MIGRKQSKVLWIIIGGVITFLFGLKCLLATDISFSDEMSYIAIALRFYKGDAMLVDDWAPMQMNGFLLMPLVGAYDKLFGSMEGIVFTFRLIYLLMKLIISLFAIYRLYSYGYRKVYVIMGVAFYYFFTPYNIDTLSYNTIPISMVFLIMVIFFTNRNKKIEWFICGVSLAVAILGHPFIIMTYIIFSLVLFGYKIIKYMENKCSSNEFDLMWLYVTGGSVFVAIIFCFFVFSRASLEDVLKNLPYILQEPDHESGILVKLGRLFYDFLFKYLSITIVNVILICICFLKKKLNYMRYLSIGTLIFSCIYLFSMRDPFIENLIYIPFLWFAGEQLLLNKNEKKYVIVYCIILFSSLGIYLGTNTRMLSTSAMMSNFAAFSCFLLAEEKNLDSKRFEKIQYCILESVLAITLLMRLLIVWTSWFNIDDFKNYIDKGPLKGMYAVENVWNDYYTIMQDLDSIEYTKDDVFFCGTSTPFAYLYLNLEYGTMGVSFFFLDYERLNDYWRTHPNKQPDILYYYKLSHTEEENQFISGLYDNYFVKFIDDRLVATKIYSE